MNNAPHNETLVFVYGTLKRGEPNYYMMEKCDGGQRARFVGEGETVRTFPLVIGSRFNVPLLIDLPGDGQKISGEIYAVNKEKLSILDEFEGVPSYYVRRQEEILVRPKERIAADSEEQPCTYFCDMYFIQNHNPKLLRLPMIGRYSSFDSHGLRYIPGDSVEDVWDEIHSPEVRLPTSTVPPPPWTAYNPPNQR